MSIAQPVTEIDYPETDGQPMGETDLHQHWMIRIRDILKQRYRNQRVYVASDLLLYYEEGAPSKFVVPDEFVVLNCDPGFRPVFKTWEEQRVPDVVIEVTSRGTSRTDIVDKPVLYEQLGVRDYFLYDPTAEYLDPPLQGYHLTDGVLKEIPTISGGLGCKSLGIELSLAGRELVMKDAGTGAVLPTEAKANEGALRAAEARVRELENELRRLHGGDASR